MKRLLLIIALIALPVVLLIAQDDRPLYALPNANTPVFQSSSMALTEDGRTLITANMLNDTVSVVEPANLQILAEIPVGVDPRSVALTPDGERVLVVNRGEGTLSIINLADFTLQATYPVGVLPYAVVTDDDSSAYVSLQGANEVVRVDLSNGAITSRIAVPAFPAGLALWGDFLYSTHLWSGDFSLIYLPQEAVVQTVSTGADTALSQSITLDPANGLVYLPQSRSNAQNAALTFDTVVFPVVNVLDLNDLGLIRQSRLTIDTAERPVNMPFAAVLDSVRGWLFVVNAGSDDLSVINLATGQSEGHISVGANPRGVLLSRNRGLAYVHNMIDGSITIVDTRNLEVVDVLPVSDLQVPIDIFLGAQLFHTADDPRMSQDDWVSCASCHFDGLSDGRVWAGAEAGPRNTPLLYALGETGPYTWTGDWDELADVEHHLRRLQVGEGLIEAGLNPPMGDPNTGASLDLDTLVTYLQTLEGPDSPPAADPELIERGEVLFNEIGCTDCHTGELGTDNQAYDVGTGGEINTPTINWLRLSAPYYHDGRAATLEEVFALPGAHRITGQNTPEEIDALIAYLLNRP